MQSELEQPEIIEDFFAGPDLIKQDSYVMHRERMTKRYVGAFVGVKNLNEIEEAIRIDVAILL